MPHLAIGTCHLGQDAHHRTEQVEESHSWFVWLIIKLTLCHSCNHRCRGDHCFPRNSERTARSASPHAQQETRAFLRPDLPRRRHVRPPDRASQPRQDVQGRGKMLPRRSTTTLVQDGRSCQERHEAQQLSASNKAASAFRPVSSLLSLHHHHVVLVVVVVVVVGGSRGNGGGQRRQ